MQPQMALSSGFSGWPETIAAFAKLQQFGVEGHLWFRLVCADSPVAAKGFGGIEGAVNPGQPFREIVGFLIQLAIADGNREIVRHVVSAQGWQGLDGRPGSFSQCAKRGGRAITGQDQKFLTAPSGQNIGLTQAA
jgi:hypothetical protein